MFNPVTIGAFLMFVPKNMFPISHMACTSFQSLAQSQSLLFPFLLDILFYSSLLVLHQA